MRLFFVFLLMAPLTFFLSGCGSSGKQDPYDNKSAEEIYQTGFRAMKRGDYQTAVNAYQGLEAHYPFGDYTEQGQLNIIYAHYKYEEGPAAVFAADRYIRLHPRSNHLDWAFYMKGLATFNDNGNILERILPINASKRDINSKKGAFFHFNEFLIRYPNSLYAPDARQRLLYLRNSMGENELHAAEYYYKRGAYLASANRALGVIQQYDKTEVMPEVLVLLEKSYRKLELFSLAEDVHAVLLLNYPGYTE